MSPLYAIAPALPLGKAGKFVAAAYIVVFVLVLAYVTIMAIRSRRTDRELERLKQDVEAIKAARELEDAREFTDGPREPSDRDRAPRPGQIA